MAAFSSLVPLNKDTLGIVADYLEPTRDPLWQLASCGGVDPEFQTAAREAVSRLWKRAFPQDAQGARNASEYPLIQAWIKTKGLPTAETVELLYQKIRTDSERLGDYAEEHLDAVDTQYGRDNLGPAYFQALEKALQSLNDWNIVRIWPHLQSAILAEDLNYVIPDLVTVQETKDWLAHVDQARVLGAIRRLDLSGLKLTKIPDEFFKLPLTALRSLQLEDNFLRSLPEEGFLQNCPNLRVLSLDNNELTSLPVIQNFAHLRRLSLDNNQLKTLPDHFLQGCPQLRCVRLKYNLLDSLPNFFLQNCPHIEEVDLDFNNLSILPNGFLQNSNPLLAKKAWPQKDGFVVSVESDCAIL
jgi:hypothetical protein